MVFRVPLKRKLTDTAARGLICISAFVAVLPLVLILAYLAVRGVPALSWEFFTRNPMPLGSPGGGMLNAIVGTVIIVGLASVMAVPLGVLTGVYLGEYGVGTFARAVRFLSDSLAGIPSIAAGIFAYSFIVTAMGHFSALAGSVALAILILPVVIRTTEDALRMVPGDIREAAYALGITRWRSTLRIVLPAARAPIVTGALLGIARASGETAPLLFTAFGTPFLTFDPSQPMSALPLQIYVYATSPYEVNWNLAWAAALTLVTIVLLLNVVARVISAKSRSL